MDRPRLATIFTRVSFNPGQAVLTTHCGFREVLTVSVSAESASFPVNTKSKLWWLSLVSAGLLVITVLAIGATVWNLRSQAVADARRDIDNLATILAQQTHRSVLAVDLVLEESRSRSLGWILLRPSNSRLRSDMLGCTVDCRNSRLD